MRSGREFQQWEPPHNGQLSMILSVFLISLLVLTLVAFIILSFGGFVRIGRPKLLSASICSGTDEQGRPIRKEVFDSEDTSVTLFASIVAFRETEVEVRWFHEGLPFAKETKTFQDLVGRDAGRIFTARGNVLFELEASSQGLDPGQYEAHVYIDGNKVKTLNFKVLPSDQKTVILRSQYRDEKHHFIIRYPRDFLKADPATLGGAVVGFISRKESPYPPRFAVTITKFESVSLDYLNGIIKNHGAKEDELFYSYSLGACKGARRTFSWEFGENEKISLKSIQVVVQGKEYVYGIDCHSLAGEFDENLPVFNAIISSFRVLD